MAKDIPSLQKIAMDVLYATLQNLMNGGPPPLTRPPVAHCVRKPKTCGHVGFGAFKEGKCPRCANKKDTRSERIRSMFDVEEETEQRQSFFDG